MQIDGRFWLTKESQNFLGAGRIHLLEWVDKTGSINAAAKAMKMSYKAAWERINGMNLLADSPLIERVLQGDAGEVEPNLPPTPMNSLLRFIVSMNFTANLSTVLPKQVMTPNTSLASLAVPF